MALPKKERSLSRCWRMTVHSPHARYSTAPRRWRIRRLTHSSRRDGARCYSSLSAAVLILSGLGFLVHAYVSFKSREMQFALMRTVGFSMRQLTTLVLLEQVLVIGAGLALGTWMGGRLGASMMPFLGHDDRGTQVLPPFVVDVNWQTLTITYLAMGLLFAIIITGLILLVRRISLQRILRLGEV